MVNKMKTKIEKSNYLLPMDLLRNINKKNYI